MRMRHLAAIAVAATLGGSAVTVVSHASSGGTGAACGPASGGASNSINGALGGQNQALSSIGILDQLMIPLLGNAAGGSSSSASTGSGISTSDGSSISGSSGNTGCGGFMPSSQLKAMQAGTRAAETATSTHHSSSTHSNHHGRRSKG